MKNVLFLLFILATPLIWSQNYKFGKVSKSELSEKFYPLDSTVDATILYTERKTRFEYSKQTGFSIIDNYFTRIKIYNSEGYINATKKIHAYHSNNGRERVNRIKAITYNLESDKIIETKLDKKQIFNEEKSEHWNTYLFTMPNLKPGCIVEWKYTLTTPFKGNLRDVVLQKDIPIKKIKVNISAPEFYYYKTKSKGYRPIPLIKDSKTGLALSTTYIENTFSIDMQDIPALIDEPFSGNIYNYYSGVVFELSYIKWPNEPINAFATDWEAVVKKIYDSSSFGNELEKKLHYKEDLKEAVKNLTVVDDRIAAILQFVKDKIKWNDKKGVYTNEGVKKAYKNGLGNVAEINLNLISMLRFAGIKADPVLVSTVSHGIPFFPTMDGFNYVIARVKTPNGNILLDATDKYALPNVLPDRVHNFRGRVIRENGTSDWVDLFPKKHSSRKTNINVKFDELGFSGTARKTITNNFLLDYRDVVQDKNKDELLEWIDDSVDDIEVINARVANIENLDKNVTETIKFETESFYEEIAGKTYITPLLYKKLTENPFKSDKREFPVFFNTPWSSSTTIKISIPENYSVESVPEPIQYKLPNDMGAYGYQVAVKGNIIQVQSTMIINNPVIPVENYQALKEFYKNIITKQTERIVLIQK